jgi:DNA-binding helix-hairpin-helix protein with protein kinase domain
MRTFTQFLEFVDNSAGLRSKTDILQSQRLKNQEESDRKRLQAQAELNRQREQQKQKNRFQQSDNQNQQQQDSALVQAKNRRQRFKTL